MKNGKPHLDDLRVHSFVTTLNARDLFRFRGGETLEEDSCIAGNTQPFCSKNCAVVTEQPVCAR